jgi:hypothetical protein
MFAAVPYTAGKHKQGAFACPQQLQTAVCPESPRLSTSNWLIILS